MGGTKRKAVSSSAPYIKRSRMSNMRFRPRYPKQSFGTIQRSAVYDVALVNGGTIGTGISLNSAGINVGTTNIPFQGGGEIGAMYDAYRIMKVKVQVIYNQNNSNVNQYATTLPYIATAIDHDSVTPVPTLATISQRDSVRYNNFGEGGGFQSIRTFVPKIAMQAYGGALTSGYVEPKPYQWVSTANLGSSDPLHYGWLAVIEDQNETASAGNNGNLRFVVTAYFQLKHGQ